MEPVRYSQGRGQTSNCGCPTSNRNSATQGSYQNHMQSGSGRSSTSAMPCRERDNDKHDMFPIGMSYVPWQSWGDLYPPEKGLCEGTIFMELNQIFCGKRGGCA